MCALQRKGDCQTALLEALKARVGKYYQVKVQEEKMDNGTKEEECRT